MNVLFLVTRFPVPPWRGDQVRAFHHLRQLAGRHTITCCALVLRPPSAAERAAVEALGVRTVVVPLGLAGAVPALARVLAGDPRPLQVLLFLRRRAAAAVARLVASTRFDVVHAQLVRAAAYLPSGASDASGASDPSGRSAAPGVPAVVDLIDALSANFARRGRAERGPLAAVSAWEAARLRACEGALIATGAPCLVVSAHERAALGDAPNVHVVPNGIDAVAFAYHEGGRPPARLVFGGNLGYFPNVDAATWLADDILPRVRAVVPDAELRLVGARPARAVRGLVGRDGVSLAGAVPAMAPELAGATVAVVPLRAGSGLQNKVLEAMAVGTPVVATSRALAGIEARPGEHLLVANDAAGLAAAAVGLLRNPDRARELARAARALVERRYRWEESAAGVEAAWRDASVKPRAARPAAVADPVP